MQIAPTQDEMTTAIKAFITAIVEPEPAWEIFVGQGNRVPEPEGTRFVVITPTTFPRLSTNVDTDADVKFTGSIALDVLTVTAVAFGSIAAGATVFGVDVAGATKILEQLTGSPAGGVGTYRLTESQTVASRALSSGAVGVVQSAEAVVQLDFHSDDTDAATLAALISTLMRDPWAVAYFVENFPLVSPLFADDPAQRPFINAEQQYEWRWVLEAHFQVNFTTSVPQQYADSVSVDVVSVDAAYPPA